ncbi:MAG: hypothetical protein HY906_00160 [Deltaproteobacteria bacterium]|nr:hypothetical protein [Deltaproteobacteria bacterium]
MARAREPPKPPPVTPPADARRPPDAVPLPPPDRTPPGATDEAATSPEPGAPPTASASATSRGRIASYVLLGAGAGAAVLGGALYAGGGADRAQLQALLQADGKLPPPTDQNHRVALDLMPKVDGNRVTSFALLGAGVGLAAAGAAAFFLFPGDAPAQVALAPLDGGAFVQLSGSF